MEKNTNIPSAGTSKERFTKAGFIISAIGSSAGLGNIWKFPYITGKYGGAAFFLLFTICLLVVGFPILLAELAMGRFCGVVHSIYFGVCTDSVAGARDAAYWINRS